MSVVELCSKIKLSSEDTFTGGYYGKFQNSNRPNSFLCYSKEENLGTVINLGVHVD